VHRLINLFNLNLLFKQISYFKEMNNISVYIILFGDLGFLDTILENINDKVKEIIIVDGPYVYNIEYLKKLDLFYDAHSKPQQLIDIIDKYNIVYFNKIFKNEEEKRIFGYNQCSYENVLLVDSDEFFVINESLINRFISSKFYVGGFGIYNMNKTNLFFDRCCTKFVLFKKSKISAEHHLDYLWLVGCKQNEKNNSYLFSERLGMIYHQTLNRTKYNNIIKFIFYITLYFHNKNESRLFDNYNFDNLIEILGVENLQTIFYHSKLDLIGMPPDINKKLNFINPSINLEQFSSNHHHAILKKESLMVKNIPFFCYIENNTLYFENVKELDITIYTYNINEKPILKNYQLNGTVFHFDLNVNNYATIGMFLCKETLTDDIMCKIKV